MLDLVFGAIEDAGGSYCAECLTEDISTQGDSGMALRQPKHFSLTSPNPNEFGFTL
jgi:hypothetical protein